MRQTPTIWSTIGRHLTATLLATGLATGASAGEFFEKNGAALRGYDAVAYVNDSRAAEGRPELVAEYKGSVFRFATPSNREAFIAAPERYAPQYGGYCAFGVAGGYKAATDPAAFTVVDGKLYLNYNREVQKQWSSDIPGFIASADQKWPKVVGQTKVHE